VGEDDGDDVGATVSLEVLLSSVGAAVGWTLGKELTEGSTLEDKLVKSEDGKAEGYSAVGGPIGLDEGVSLSPPQSLHEHFAMFGRNHMSSSSIVFNSAGQKPTLVPSINL
jgi:hypothetical protein